MDPNDDFLKKEPEIDESSPTVVRGADGRELARSVQRRETPDTDWDIKVLNPAARREEPRLKEETVWIGEPEPAPRRKERRDEASPGMERLLAAIGVVAAILIVAVVVVIFVRLGGIFHKPSGEKRPSTETVESSTEEGIASTA